MGESDPGEKHIFVMRMQQSSSGPNLTSPQSLSLSDTNRKVPSYWALVAERFFLCFQHWVDWAASEHKAQGTQERPIGYHLCCTAVWFLFLTDSSWSLCDLTSIFHIFAKCPVREGSLMSSVDKCKTAYFTPNDLILKNLHKENWSIITTLCTFSKSSVRLKLYQWWLL